MACGQILVILDEDDHEDDTAEYVSHNVDDDDWDDGLDAGGRRDGLGELHQQGDGGGHAVQEREAVH